MNVKFELRRDAVKAMVYAQFPWVNYLDIEVYDHTGWSEPHYKVEFRDDGKDRVLIVKIDISEV